ncbi:alpha/beta fold hydrolase [Cohnella pontilimi]|uniref:Alpha/beta fold hydrolase n=1 Tax=Cohnella pontilimi TaxID=2564100 RepID=A0A4U0F7P3_9BACL|nr:alpha/beta fold hydrolase [Cohnella pontilimi]TJY40703.1 alpha/beta fold hydrolase [Cohnella pontilimi]
MQLMWIIIGVLFAAGAVAGLSLWYLTVKSQSPKRLAGGEQPAYPYEKVLFSSEGTSIAGWFIPNQPENSVHKRPVVILAHGWGSGKSRMLRYVTPLYEAGYAILMFDARGHGESGPIDAPTVKSFRDDVLAALEYASRRDEVDSDCIAILAHSFGGFGSVLALKKTQKIRALVTDSMPARFDSIMKAYLSKSKLRRLPLPYFLLRIGMWRAGISSQEAAGFDLVPIIQSTTTPLLMMHSLNDDYVPVSELQYLMDHAPRTRHRYLHTPGHRNSHKDPHFWSELLPFLREGLA